MSGIHIGTSGWFYKGWSGAFYPEDLAPSQWLTFYARHFSTVEINSTFYRLPFQNMVKGWRQRAPEGFTFAVKGSRRITHLKKLVDIADDLNKFIDRVSELGEYLGPILWQLPPQLQLDLERLESFLALLPRGISHAVEFRHPSWLEDTVFEVLRRFQVAPVTVSSLRMPADFTTTANFTYLRLHGLEGGYSHDYSREELAPWAEHICRCASEGLEVYAFFNNDGRTRAPANAGLLTQMIR
jgi:uncharacterized protein YecE (DUF72 family)